MISTPSATRPTLPRFCRRHEFATLPGLFATPPSETVLKNWQSRGLFVFCEIAGSRFVNVHATLKKLNIKP